MEIHQESLMTEAVPIIPVILSGGAGTRLWPMSRPEMPKQLLALTAEQTMLQITALRTADNPLFAAPILVASAAHAAIIEAQLDAVSAAPQFIILEPMGRNTAPAIALAAIAAGAGNTPLLVMPSDHIIDDVAAFHTAIERALPRAREGWLVTFGIKPEGPETGYGWLKIGEAIAPGVHRVAQFVEKPPLDRAEAMFVDGGYCWNGGIFLFRADHYLEALGVHAPDMLAAAQHAMAGATQDAQRLSPDHDSFAASPADSIDYAVMEKADRVAVVPVSMGWNDVGSWDSLDLLSPRDGDGNVLGGQITVIDTSDCFVRSNGLRIAIAGVSNLIVVADGNDILILPRGRSQDVKKLLDAMKR